MIHPIFILRFFSVLMVVFIVVFSQVASSQINLKIDAEKSRRFKLLLMPTVIANDFNAQACTLPAQKITKSLMMFSTFNVLPVTGFLQRTIDQLDEFPNELRMQYAVKGVDFLVRSTVSSTAGTCSIAWSMFSVASGHLIDSGDFQIPAEYSSGLYYYLADRIAKLLNGKKTLHFSEIAYTVRKVSDNGDFTWKLIRAWANGEKIEEVMSSDLPLLSPAWSHDGQKLAFVTYDQSSNQVVRVLDMATKRIYNPIASASPASSPAWSPSDDALIVAISQQGQTNLFIQPLGASELIRLTKQAAIDTESVWLPNGRSLAYVSDRSGISTVYSFDMFTGTRTRVTRDGIRAALPKFIKKGYAEKLQLIYLSGVGISANLFIIEHNSLKQVSKIPLPHLDQYDVSPEGSYIVATLSYGEDADGDISQKSLIIYDIATNSVIEVEAFEQVITGMSWRPSTVNLYNK